MFRHISCAAFALISGLAPRAEAQMPRTRGGDYGTEPGYWVGLSLGYLESSQIIDGQTGNQWTFGYTSQIQATFEKTLQRGVTVGVSAGFATAPLTYEGFSFNSFNSCGGSCQANADISQYMAFVRFGGGLGFHPIYSFEAGVTEFSNFREQVTNQTLDPIDAAYDFSFGGAGGGSYGFSPTVDAYVTGQFDLILHPQGNTTTITSAPRQWTYRAGFRIGF
ncbi:MAG TPA: hypothetical protein VII52_15715 [Gemmatimonadaceae bacterium]